MSLIAHHRHALAVIDGYVGASGTRYANLDQVGLLEKWLDTFDAHLVDVDILDYPGAEKAADEAATPHPHGSPSPACTCDRCLERKALLSNAPGAVIEYNPSSLADVMNAWYLPPPPKRVKRQHLLMEQQRRNMADRAQRQAWVDDYKRRMLEHIYVGEGRP